MEFTNSIPTERIKLNAWCRSFAALEPAANQAIEFYSTYPCKFLQIKKPSDKGIKSFFDVQIDKIGLIELLPEILREYWTVGECYVYADLDEKLSMWSKLIIQNPDYIIVKRGIFSDESQIFLRPDEKLRSLVLKEDPSEAEKRDLDRLDESIKTAIKNGENIPLSNFYTSCFVRRQSPYEVRGASVLVPVLKKLAILEKVRTIGKEWNHVLTDQQQLEQEIKEALGHPDVLVKNDGAIRKDVAKHRMLQTMSMMRDWMERKIFAPIAKINEFYEYKNGKKELVIPKVTIDSKGLSEILDKACAQPDANSAST